MEDNISTNVVPILEYFTSHPLNHQGDPMIYQPTSVLDHSRLPDVIEAVQSVEDMFSERMRVGARVNTHVTQEQEHTAQIMLGLVYMMVGGLDEAHDIVVPYSVPVDTSWGGAAILDSPALGNANYLHAVIHRSEGKYVGLGALKLVGWDNAKCWFSRTPQDHEVFKRFSSRSEELGAQREFAEVDRALYDVTKAGKTWCWDNLTDLFATTHESDDLTLFCNELHNTEILLLFEHCNAIVNI